LFDRLRREQGFPQDLPVDLKALDNVLNMMGDLKEVVAFRTDYS
jgi:hypothetical protein